MVKARFTFDEEMKFLIIIVVEQCVLEMEKIDEQFNRMAHSQGRTVRLRFHRP